MQTTLPAPTVDQMLMMVDLARERAFTHEEQQQVKRAELLLAFYRVASATLENVKRAVADLEPIATRARITAPEVRLVVSSKDPKKVYRVRRIGGQWVCSCPGFGYRDKCKHLPKS